MSARRKRGKYGVSQGFRVSHKTVRNVDDLSVALSIPKGKVVDLAVEKLLEDWKTGRVTGVGLLVSANGS